MKRRVGSFEMSSSPAPVSQTSAVAQAVARSNARVTAGVRALRTRSTRALVWLFSALIALVLLQNTANAQRRPSSTTRAQSFDAAVNSADAAVTDAESNSPNGANAADGSVEDAPSAQELEQRRTEAAEAFGAGMEAYRRGEFTTAADYFSRAFAAYPDPAPLFNMARSWEAANEITRAIAAYEQYLASNPTAQDRADVRARIELLRVRPTEVFLATQPAGAFVFIDGSAEPQPGNTPMVTRLVPGPHTVTFVRDGYTRLERRVQVAPGERTTIGVMLEADNAARASRVEPAILDRRVAISWATRPSAIIAMARAYDGQPLVLAFGGEFSLFYGRNFLTNVRFIRIEPDGAWSLASGGAGYTLPVDDIDLSLLGHVGVGWGYHTVAELNARNAPTPPPVAINLLLAVEGRLDWYFHRHLSLGAFFRLDARTELSYLRGLPSFGFSLSFNP